MVVPSFSTLFTDAAREMAGDNGPFLSAILFYKFIHFSVFFCGPWTLNEARFENFLPTVETLDFCSMRQALGDKFPIFCAMFFDSVT